MRINDARKFLIVSSLVITFFQIVFLFIAPLFGFPLSHEKARELLLIISPAFVGYLGLATHFVFRPGKETVKAKNKFLGLLLKGCVAIYVVTVATSFFAFGYSNRVSGSIGDGISVESLSAMLAFALSFLAGTTGIATSYLFSAQNGEPS